MVERIDGVVAINPDQGMQRLQFARKLLTILAGLCVLFTGLGNNLTDGFRRHGPYSNG